MPQLDEAGFRWLWLRPADGRFSTTEIEGLTAALAPLRLIAWFPPPTFVAEKNPRGEPARFAGRFSVEIANLGVDYRSFVRWVEKDDFELLAELLQPLGAAPFARFRVVLAAIPYDSVIAARFSKAVQGPAWLWLCPEWVANAAVPLLDSPAVVASYTKLVSEMQGIAFLAWADGKDRYGVAALADSARIDAIATGLSARAEFLEYPELLLDLSNSGVTCGMFYRGRGLPPEK